MPVSIPTILNEVVSILEHSIDKRIQISQVLNANPSTVIGDASQLQNALLNIAINARDAMPDGGKLTFETHIAKLDEAFCRSRVEKLVPDRYLVVAISDSGSGIPPAVMQKIFEPFYTTKEIGKGTGMGLASAYGTLRSHHGFIDVVSEVGRGSTFSLYLPLPDRIDSRRAAEADTRPTPGLIPGQGRILLVDDEEMVRSVGREMLQDLGYRVNLCPDGEAGLDYYRQHWREIDLVILDMIMPNRNGRDTFAAMQAINPEILAILSSGYIIGAQAQSVLREGVRDFMTKPFEQVELSQKIAKVLSG